MSEGGQHRNVLTDLRRYDRVWQRVAPALAPWPEGECGALPGRTVPPESSASNTIVIRRGNMTRGRTAGVERTPLRAAPSPAEAASSTEETAPAKATAVAAASNAASPAVDTPEALLPGAEVNPCCMGSEAAEDLDVLAGFIEEELSEQRHLTALSRQAPLWARQGLREMAAGSASHARRLMAVYYLITGERYVPAVSLDRIYVGKWCPALRERYQWKACGALNYQRAAEGTADPCLAKILAELGTEDFQYASALLRMLEKSMGTTEA